MSTNPAKISSAVFGVIPEVTDETVKPLVPGAHGEAVAYNIVGDNGNDAPGNGVLAPGFEGVGVDLLDGAGVVVVFLGGEVAPSGGVVDADGDGVGLSGAIADRPYSVGG